MKARKPFGGGFRYVVAIWSPFELGDLPSPIDELSMLTAILALGGVPHVYTVVATQLKFLKKGITFVIT